MDRFADLGGLVGERRVTPSIPTGHRVFTDPAEVPDAQVQRDASSAWAALIVYENAKGKRSSRRISCQAIKGFASAETVISFCHERRMVRSFRIDRIIELICAETGEVLDPVSHFDHLRLTGALSIKDDALLEVVRVLAFLARCDGEYHPLESTALEDTLMRYAVRFGGTDASIEAALKGARRLAPDGDDLIKALERFSASPLGPKLSRFILDAGADLIAADGRLDSEEARWAVEMSNLLKEMAVR